MPVLRWPRLLEGLALSVSGLAGYLRPLSLFNLLIPRTTYRVHPDLPYGPRLRQRLDVYLPRQEAQNLPVILFFYGGSWQRGQRRDYRFVAQALTAQGFVTVIPDYRLYPEGVFPAFIQDGAAACAWVRENIRAWGGDPHRLFVMGHSAGAYIAAMLALDRRYLDHAGLPPDSLRGFIGLAGPYDFLPLTQPRLIEIFGAADGIPHTQPVNFVTAQAPPALLLHGAADRIVGPDNTRNLARRWRAAGRPVREIIYPHYHHLAILLVLASFLQDGEPVLPEVAAFVRQYR